MGDLGKALASRYPHLSGKQLRRLEVAMVREVGAAVAAGLALGLEAPSHDGSAQFTPLWLDRAAEAAAMQ